MFPVSTVNIEPGDKAVLGINGATSSNTMPGVNADSDVNAAHRL